MTVAEAGSISRAAARLKIAQAGLTAQLRRIEDSLGGSLFVRRPDGVGLTDLGAYVVRRGGELTGQFDDLLTTARLLGRSEGAVAAYRTGGTDAVFVPRLAAAVARLVPGAEQTTSQQRTTAATWDLLRTRELDMATASVCAPTGAPAPGDLLSRTVAREPCEIVLVAGHRLAARAAVGLRDLAEESWVAPDDRVDGLRLGWRLACEQAGFAPRVRHFGADQRGAAELVAGGHAVAIGRASDPPRPGVVRRPLANGRIEIRTRLFWTAESPLNDLADELGALLASPPAAGSTVPGPRAVLGAAPGLPAGFSTAGRGSRPPGR
jgi:DNA-binding transcriptional LysR family regulator